MTSVLAKLLDTASTGARLPLRWLVLLGVLGIEGLGILYLFEAPSVSDHASWPAWLFANSREIWPLGAWCIGASLLTLAPRFPAILGDLRIQSSGYRWPIWLVCHLLAFAAFAVVTALVFGQPTDPARLAATWFAVWFGLGSAALLLWLLALAPRSFWMCWVRRERGALVVGVALGSYVWMVVGMLVRQEAPLAQMELWSVLSDWTLRGVRWLLGWVYADLVVRPELLLVGTDAFQVEISYACSGIEGISLITLFLAIYLWLFRQELRFPQALWLFPLGIVAIWLANVVRIAALVAIGVSFSPEIAGEGFHAHAGWVVFIFIAFGALVLSHRRWFLAPARPAAPVAGNPGSLAAALLIPFMVLMAASLIAAAFSAGFPVLYPLPVMAAAAALWYYRRAYRVLGWGWSWQAAVIGVIVFLLWMLLEPPTDGRQTELASGIAELSPGSAVLWLAFRVAGSVLLVPVVEELAFRGYLLRKLVAADFENVRPGQFTWLSFLVSSVLFGLLHERWLAGTLAGMAYALAWYHRGRLGDAVLAHVTTNALIAVQVLAHDRWALWSSDLE
jgi:exosortase E/protease (VPEID-CTERM system)